MKKGDFEQLFRECLDFVGKAGGSIGNLPVAVTNRLNELDAMRRQTVLEACDTVIRKKLSEFDNLVIESAIRNMNDANRHMCSINFPLISYARNRLAEQRYEVAIEMSAGIEDKTPFDTSFIQVDGNVTILPLSAPSLEGTKEDREDFKLVRGLREKGKSIREIAKELGFSRSKVGVICKELSI